jgi:hypothetical protein
VVTYSPGGTAEVAAIPFSSSSSSRRVVVEGWAAGPDGDPSYLLSRGSSVRSSVASAGGGAKKLSILLARINSFLSLTSAETRTVQVLTEGRIGHTTNVTLRGEIIVTGGRTIPGGSGLGSEQAFLEEPTYLASVERIDEATNTAIPSSTDKDLDLERAWHTGTSLETGQVILAGGFGSYWVPNPANPGSWVRTCCQALDTRRPWSTRIITRSSSSVGTPMASEPTSSGSPWRARSAGESSPMGRGGSTRRPR